MNHPATDIQNDYLTPPKSDVWFCERCHQLTLSDVGGPPIEDLGALLKNCDESIVDQVLER